MHAPAVEILARGKFLVLGVATMGGCLVTGLAWFAILWVVGGLVGIGSPGFRIASTAVTILAVVAMLGFIWWLVVKFLPRLDRVVDQTAGGLRTKVGLGGHAPSPFEAVAGSDAKSGPSLAELDAGLTPGMTSEEAASGKADE